MVGLDPSHVGLQMAGVYKSLHLRGEPGLETSPRRRCLNVGDKREGAPVELGRSCLRMSPRDRNEEKAAQERVR